nr:MAG TPA: hypothetical protein [Caudoviricetes sp.]
MIGLQFTIFELQDFRQIDCRFFTQLNVSKW